MEKTIRWQKEVTIHKYEVNGVPVEFDDGDGTGCFDGDDNKICDFVELHGILARRADAANEYLRIREMVTRGFKVYLDDILVTSENILELLVKRHDLKDGDNIIKEIRRGHYQWRNADNIEDW